MSDVLIPRCAFRWLNVDPEMVSLGNLTLQQLYETPGGKQVWRDVPIVSAPHPHNGEKT